MEINKGKTVTSVMVITVISKCLGFSRDMILAYYFGSNLITDAYLISQTIPESLFSLVVQAIGIGLIPIYTDIFHHDGEERANRFVDNVLLMCWLLTICLVVFVYLFPNRIVKIFAHGFSQDALRLAIKYVRITVFAMFFKISSSVFSSFLQAKDIFVLTALNGIVLDIVVIVSIILAFYIDDSILAWGIVFSAIAQMILLLPFVLKNKSTFSFKTFSFHDKNLLKIVKLFIPVMLGVGVSQVNLLIDRTLASTVSGGVSALNYANKVGLVFENIIILSLATVMFPSFAKYISQENFKKFSDSVYKSLEIVFITMIPCMLFLMFFSDEIIRLLFGRGAFDNSAIVKTSNAMFFYSIGLVAVSINAILVRALYALQKAKYVSYLSCLSLIVNICLNYYFLPFMGINGLALATSISNWVLTFLLAFYLKNYIGQYFRLRDCVKEGGKCLLAAIISSILMIFLFMLIQRLLLLKTNYILLGVISLLSLSIYIVVLIILKSDSLFTILNVAKSFNWRKK